MDLIWGMLKVRCLGGICFVENFMRLGFRIRVCFVYWSF